MIISDHNRRTDILSRGFIIQIQQEHQLQETKNNYKMMQDIEPKHSYNNNNNNNMELPIPQQTYFNNSTQTFVRDKLLWPTTGNLMGKEFFKTNNQIHNESKIKPARFDPIIHLFNNQVPKIPHNKDNDAMYDVDDNDEACLEMDYNDGQDEFKNNFM